MTNKFQLIIYLGVFSLLSGSKSHAQSYIPMLSDSIYWDVAYAVNDPNPCAIYGAVGPFRYALSGDTLINNISYRKMIGYEFFPLTPAPCPPFSVDTISQNFDLFLREDTIGRKVYRFNGVGQMDELLFDFSLQQGDSIYLPGSVNTYFYVDSLYPITTADGITRSYFECFPRPWTTGGYYVEGIGGAMGPFERPYHVFEEGYWLMCAKDINDNAIFGPWNSFFNCFNFATGLNTNEEIINASFFYPNPATDFIYLIHSIETTSFRIINMVGESVLTKENINDSGIDISHLSSGIYFVVLEMEGVVVRERLIKY